MLIFHITPRDRWRSYQNQQVYYRADSLDSQGFIHCSFQNQLLRTANKWFPGQRDLVVLWIDSDRLTAELRLEESESGEIFPHIYGPLNLDAVLDVAALQTKPSGEFELPARLDQSPR
jgi:uncharacterized protein (DUF952 family)